jgi:hypothetical protein
MPNINIVMNDNSHAIKLSNIHRKLNSLISQEKQKLEYIRALQAESALYYNMICENYNKKINKIK